MSRLALLFAALLALSFLPGCTLIGLGVGAATSKYEYRTVTEETTHAERGESVSVETREGSEVTGVVQRSDEATVTIGAKQLPLDEITKLRVTHLKRFRSSSHALDGALAGMGLDIALGLLGVIVYGISQIHLDYCIVCYRY
jgi:hypothetical protein